VEFPDRKIEILASAAFEMDAAFVWHEDRRRGLGTAFLRECDAAFTTLARMPQAYRVVHPRIRRALLRRFPYMVFFEAHEDRVVILGVVHVRQSPEVWPFAR